MQESTQRLNLEGIKFLSIMYHDLGMLHYSKREFEKALSFLQEAHKLLGIIYTDLNRTKLVDPDVLEDFKEQMDGIEAKIAETTERLRKEGRKELFDTIEHYKNVLYQTTGDDNAFYNIGKSLLEIGAYNSALIFLNKCLSINSENSEAYRMVGDIYSYQKNEPIKAITYYEKYLEYNPNNGLVYNMLGHLYESASKYENIDKQLEYFQKSVDLMPDLKCAIKNLALVYPRVGRNEDALKCYHRLFELGPSMDDLFDYACLKIKMSDFQEGWKYYEHRFQKENGATFYPPIDLPKWTGENIPNSTLLVQYEQGFGDSMQFFRYLPQLKKFAKKIIFRVQDSLVDLLKINAGDIEVVGVRVPLQALQFDYHVPLMSLPYLLKASIDNIPKTEGYLKADEAKTQTYKEKYFDNDCFKIGISWNGSKDGNARRNIPLEVFYPLSKLPNVKIYSFQKGFGSEQLENLPEGVEIINLGDTFNDFSDTAAAMSNLDLFISSDNGVFNLAGCMGQRTFLLLNQDCEWRWFFDAETTPWYDSVKIFKKIEETDGWEALMQRVFHELHSELNSK
jgi:tetratricopeptide (TPR) repeat protein